MFRTFLYDQILEKFRKDENREPTGEELAAIQEAVQASTDAKEYNIDHDDEASEEDEDVEHDDDEEEEVEDGHGDKERDANAEEDDNDVEFVARQQVEVLDDDEDDEDGEAFR